MYINKNKSMILTILLCLGGAQSQAAVSGDITNFTSPNGLTEQCTALEKSPNGHYSDKDIAKEKEFCSIDFYNNTVAMCAKTWSTSPGTIIHDINGTGKTSLENEAAHCKSKETGLKTIAKFKTTMNRADTSGTYSYAPLWYYHFSRILDTTVDVPVAVHRTIDKKAHYDRVSSKANPSPSAKMNSAGWAALRAAELNPASYGTFAIDLFTPDYKQIRGAMMKDKGTRYGVEINGTRASGWGDGQNYDFQKTPGFLALQSDQPLQQAFDTAAAQAFKDPAMARAFAADRATKLGRPSDAQMALWARELSEIAILDYIFSQQDRIGNIDYVWFWAFKDESGNVKLKKEDSELSRLAMAKIPVPKDIAAYHPILVQKSQLNDNDAGVMLRYANFTKSTGMLDGIPPKSPSKVHAPIRHLNINTYRSLLHLALDLKAQGPIYHTLSRAFDTNASVPDKDRFKNVINNVQAAANIFIKNCQDHKMRFDIPDFDDAVSGKFEETPVQNCLQP